MTNSEFSDTFTTLLNSYNTQAQFGEEASHKEVVLDEYEKSVLLTMAQDIIVKSYFDGTLNPQNQGFDDSARRQVDFSNLIRVKDITPSSGGSEKKFDERGIIFKLPTIGADNDTCDVLFILNEKVILEERNNSGTFDKIGDFVIIPINYKEYDREMSKPYAQPLKKQAWRLFQNNATGYDIDTELILKEMYSTKYDPTPDNVGDIKATYRIRYVRRPQPIILEDMPGNLEIDGKNTETPCELNPILHMDILNKAVELAISTRGGGTAVRQEERR